MKHALACSTLLVLSLAACGGQEPAQVVNKNTLRFDKSENNPAFALMARSHAGKAVLRGNAPAHLNAYHQQENFYPAYGIQVAQGSTRAHDKIAAQRFEYDPSFEAAPAGGSIAVSDVAPIQTRDIATVEPEFTYAENVEQAEYLEPIEPIASVQLDERTGSLTESASIAGGDFIWPTQGKIVSSFGPKENGLVNDGINISASAGEPIWGAADGEVAYIGNELKGYGNMLIVRHDNGWMSAYAHAQKWSVSKGDRVKQGQMIGYVGQSGNVSEPQLHFSLRQNKTPVNPTELLPRQLASR